MLILHRGLNQRIIINDNIEIEILGIKPNQVRIGITAPRHITVHREEIYHRINNDIKKREDRHLKDTEKEEYYD